MLNRFRRDVTSSILGLMACSLLFIECHGQQWTNVADRASLEQLKQTVHQRQLRGPLGKAEVTALARAVARREILSTMDPDGEALLAHLEPCAAALAEPLSHRARRSDHTAGAALLAMVESGQTLSLQQWSVAANSPIAARRAAAAFASDAPDRWLTRERFLVDPDPQVRRAALKSTFLAPAALHMDTLSALLRSDPEPACRVLAARSLGVLGGATVETVLSDAFSGADTQLRLAIVSAWAQAATFRSGGEQRLVAVARAETGIVGALAAADLALGSSSSQAIGQARILRSLQSGASEEQQIAVTAAQWSDAEHEKSLLRLGISADPSIRALALGRWLETSRHKWPALTWLRGIAEGDDSSAIVARSILATDGEHSAIATLRRQLTYAKWQSRAQAARDLWQLQDLDGVCSALIDDAPEVRLAAACAALAEPVTKAHTRARD